MKEVHSAVDGEGLQLSGWFATWDEDSAAEAFVCDAFDKALPRYLANNPIVLHMHKKSEPPVGRVVAAHIDKSKGVYGTVLLPKPEVGTKAMDVYNAAKNGLLKSFSVGGFWKRFDVGGKTKLICDRLLEVSLAGPNVNEWAISDGGVASVIGVKAIGDTFYTLPEYERRQREADAWFQHKRAEQQLALAELRLDVAALRLR